MAKKLTNESLLTVEKNNLTLGKTFEKVLRNFVDAYTQPFGLLETVILSCVIIEALVKEDLKKINPTLILHKFDPEAIALVSGKKDKLIVSQVPEISEIRTASITELLIRLSKFKDLSAYSSALKEFFGLRNKIVHSAQNVTLKEYEITILLTKSVFPFIKSYIDVDKDIWENIEKVTFVIQDRFSTNLVRNIIKHRSKASKFFDSEIKKKIQAYTLTDEYETLYPDKLTCPACQNEGMEYIIGATVDKSEEEINVYPYRTAMCTVCDMYLQDYEIEEIIAHHEKYFSPTKKQLEAWEEALQEPDYDYFNEEDYDY